MLTSKLFILDISSGYFLSLGDVRQCARRIVDTVEKRQIENKNSEVSGVLTVTVGAVCDVPEKHNRIWDFMTAADMTLYRQKKEKKGCMRFADKVGGEV